MTLIEVVLAITVAAFVLTAAVSFVVSVSSIWAEREARNFYEDHVDGVTEFMKASFSNAGVSISTGEDSDQPDSANSSGGSGNNGELDETGTLDEGQDSIEIGLKKDTGNNNGNTIDEEDDEGSPTAGLITTSEAPVGWAKLPGASGYEEPLLNYKLTEMPLLFATASELPTLGGVDVFLHFDKDMGLSLLWYSLLQEEVDDIRDLQRTEISPLVTELIYIYWDERFEQWEEEDEPKEGEGDEEFVLPRYLKLLFEHEGETKERTLTIPVPSQSAFLF